MIAEGEECPHYGRPLTWPGECVFCSGAEKKLKKEQAAFSTPRVFPAKYLGHCHECNLPIEIGEMISWVEGKPVVHEDCVS